jgi:hypothetical protein
MAYFSILKILFNLIQINTHQGKKNTAWQRCFFITKQQSH